MDVTYSKDEFIKLFSDSGYGKKKDAENWTEHNMKDKYTSDDLATCHNDTQKQTVVRWGNYGTSKRYAQSERMGNSAYLNRDVFQ